MLQRLMSCFHSQASTTNVYPLARSTNFEINKEKIHVAQTARVKMLQLERNYPSSSGISHRPVYRTLTKTSKYLVILALVFSANLVAGSDASPSISTVTSSSQTSDELDTTSSDNHINLLPHQNHPHFPQQQAAPSTQLEAPESAENVGSNGSQANTIPYSTTTTATITSTKTPLTCEQAYTQCALRKACAPALKSYNEDCQDLIGNKTSECSPKCLKAMIALRSSEEGDDLVKCDCQEDEYCLQSKSRSLACKPQVEQAVDPKTIVSCSTASWICMADHLCSTALEFYYRNCQSLFSQQYCSLHCNNSLAILYRQPKASKLVNCRCDGSEDFPCQRYKTYTEKFCLNGEQTSNQIHSLDSDLENPTEADEGTEFSNNTNDSAEEEQDEEEEQFSPVLSAVNNLESKQVVTQDVNSAGAATESNEDKDKDDKDKDDDDLNFNLATESELLIPMASSAAAIASLLSTSPFADSNQMRHQSTLPEKLRGRKESTWPANSNAFHPSPPTASSNVEDNWIPHVTGDYSARSQHQSQTSQLRKQQPPYSIGRKSQMNPKHQQQQKSQPPRAPRPGSGEPRHHAYKRFRPGRIWFSSSSSASSALMGLSRGQSRWGILISMIFAAVNFTLCLCPMLDVHSSVARKTVY